MSINNAMKVLKKLQTDPDFRKSLFRCDSADQIFAFLEARQMPYTPEELEEAYRNLLVNCQFEAQAVRLKDALQCLVMLGRT